MSTAGIIFSNLNTTTSNYLTADRTVAAIPFGCRYRLVDFALSNMVNAEISNINIVTNYNYRSLMKHIGSGKDWDLARHGAGIRIASPYQNANFGGAKPYETHLQALCDISETIGGIHEQYVVLADSDIICNIALSEVIAYHKENGADVTMVSVKPKQRWFSRTARVAVRADGNGRVETVSLKNEPTSERDELGLNIYVMETNFLRAVLSAAKAHNLSSFTRDVLMPRAAEGRICRYLYDGYYAYVSDVREYYTKSIELATSAEARAELLGIKERPVYTNVHNTPPVRYGEEAKVSSSMIADGCVIDGTVENCILFRGVHIGRGSVVKNSILLGGTYIGKNVTLDAVIADKDVLISDGMTLSGCSELPYFIPKNKHL